MKVMLVGVPRSGTTWLTEGLARAVGTRAVMEPDNWELDPFASSALRGLCYRYPALEVGDPGSTAYDLLWRVAFRGGWPDVAAYRTARSIAHRLPLRLQGPPLTALARRAAVRPPDRPHVVVKSVQGVLALNWIIERHRPRVVLIKRDLAAVIASWRDLAWDSEVVDEVLFRRRLGLETPPPPGLSALGRNAWLMGVFSLYLDALAARHGDWLVVRHEELCSDPEAGFARVHEQLGLTPTAATWEYLRDANSSGAGMTVKRVARDLPGSWRSRLSRDEVDEIAAVFALLPLSDRDTALAPA